MSWTTFDNTAAGPEGDRKPARTAYLKTDFRAIVPIGETLCAEADSLFVELRETPV